MQSNRLPREERLRGKVLFQQLFSQGRSILSEKDRLRAIYVMYDSSAPLFSVLPAVQFAPVIPRRCGKAFWRNRAKRLLKEAYRNNKNAIVEECKAKNKKLIFIIMPVSFSQKKTPVIVLGDIEPYVTGLLEKLKRIV